MARTATADLATCTPRSGRGGIQLAPAELSESAIPTQRSLRRGAARWSVLVSCAVAALLLARWAFGSHPYAPEQPIAFSHRVHVADDKLDCELCHSAARRSPFAGIAPVERCIGCHKYVLTPHPEVAKLRRMWDARKPISWTRVYTLPQFVRFDHASHLLANVGCETCHGDVSSMDRISRVVEPTMGACVRCHRERRAPDDCLTCHY